MYLNKLPWTVHDTATIALSSTEWAKLAGLMLKSGKEHVKVKFFRTMTGIGSRTDVQFNDDPEIHDITDYDLW